MDKEIIIRNFSRCAYTYDRYADVQKCIALELLKSIKQDGIDKILEIGCGTGNYTLLLREKFSKAKLKAVDISAKMIEVASGKLKHKRVGFIADDAETINLDEKFDLITSNACFQWFDDLGRAIIKYKDLLNKDGLILFSIFGPATFWELNMVLKYASKNASTAVTKFLAKEMIKRALKNNFKKVEIKETRYEESNSSLRDLLNKIKYTGIRGGGLNAKIVFTRGLLNKLEDIYLREFTHIKATYQVFFCKAAL